MSEPTTVDDGALAGVEMALELGQHVWVRGISGREHERVVVGHSEKGDPLLVTVEKYQDALANSREPEGIGWPPEYIAADNELRELRP